MAHYPPPEKSVALEALHWLDPGVPRNTWLRYITFAKVAGLDLDEVIEWSKKASNFDSPSDVIKAWKDVKQEGSASPNSLLYEAEHDGWTPPWKRDAHQTYAPRFTYSAESLDEREARLAKQREEEEREQQEIERAQKKMHALLDAARPAEDDHPYLVRKGVSAFGLHEIPLHTLVGILGYHPEVSGKSKYAGKLEGDRILLVEFHSGNGEPVTLEMIDKIGRKSSIYKLPRKGMMWGYVHSPDKQPPVIGVAEGIATAKSVATAASFPVFACGSAGQMEAVALALRMYYPTSEIVLFADAGLTLDGVQRMAEGLGFACIPPDTERMPAGATDFNDMVAAVGEDEVAAWIQDHIVPANALSWVKATTRVEIDYVLPGLPVGSVGMIAGQGSIGKTFLALDIAASVALGRSLSGAFAGAKKGRTAVILGEDPRDVIHNRMYDMGEMHDLNLVDRRALDFSMRVTPMVGEDIRIVAVDRNVVEEGPFLSKLRSMCAGRRLMILDPLIRLHDGDENDNNIANKLLLHIQKIAIQTKCAIILLHHAGKEGSKSWTAARGASAYTTSVRWQMNVSPPDVEKEDAKYNFGQDFGPDPRLYIKCTGVKMNYDKQVDAFWMKRVAGGVLMLCKDGDLVDGEPAASSGRDSKKYTPQNNQRKSSGVTKLSSGYYDPSADHGDPFD